ncbi:MAG: DUF1573 domain-containing protein [Bacteroidia bacterium]|nr:DUF1573 domain-containing protein [Bacteroidia bacterium]
MKNLFILAFAIFGFIANLNAQGPLIKFEPISHDFGKIMEGSKVSFTFTYTNSSTSPVIIEKTEVGCGCTMPEFSKEPIQTGMTGTITVTFDSAGKKGIQNKEIKVFTNIGEFSIFINCEVMKGASDKPMGE